MNTQEDVIILVVAVLEALGIPHMLAGSFASSLHGVPRMTNDADVVIDADWPAISRLVERLEPDFYVSESAAREAFRHHTQFNAIHFESGFKLDLVIKKPRAFSDEEMRRRQPGELAGKSVDFASAEDTILTKLEWSKAGGSERQYEDARGIIRVSGDGLDWEYLTRWGEELSVSALLERARQDLPFE